MEVGIDIVQISRIEKMQNQVGFLKKYFSQLEIDYIHTKQNKIQTIAGLFACKEAFLKAVGIGIGGGIKLNEISILHDKTGKPYIDITAQINYYLMQKKCNNITVSISHDGDYAVAFCTIY